MPTIEPNKTIKPSDLSKLPIYAKWQLMPLRDRMGTLCSIQHTGILQITLFVDVATGTDLIDAKAQAIVSHFGVEKGHTINGVQILIMSSTANAAMPDGEGRFMQPISVEYRVT